MNTESPNSNPGAAPAPVTVSVDEIIQAMLLRALAVTQDPEADPRDICAFGALVLKIKEAQDEAAAAQPLARGLTPEVIRQIEEAAKLL